MNILILHAELMGYNISSIKALQKKMSANIYLINWEKGKVSEFQPKEIDFMFVLKRTQFRTFEEFQLYFNEVKFDLVLAPGWMDSLYLKITQYYKSIDIPTICAMDTIWNGSLKQKIFLPILKYKLQKSYSHAFVAGELQLTYAKKLGFKEKNIRKNCYCADIEQFKESYNYKLKQNDQPKSILFLGRFIKKKGIKALIESFLMIDEKEREGWKITFIGNGNFNFSEFNSNYIEVRKFMQPNDLIKELKKHSIFCLPSFFEPWGVVVQEMAVAGFPLLISKYCGSVSTFLENGVNGYEIDPYNKEDFKLKLLKLINNSKLENMQMAKKSNELGIKLTPEKWAENFSCFLGKKQ